MHIYKEKEVVMKKNQREQGENHISYKACKSKY